MNSIFFIVIIYRVEDIECDYLVYKFGLVSVYLYYRSWDWIASVNIDEC